ncbi:L,D-transpeptidase [Cellulomonas sp. zg-ZUI222]|uniref:L,D-transpeptidase n=1 Tax=Cellulomonas wangleii TaxID=2816956 RepID=A0ABX8D8G4_9CELL|nr:MULTISPECIES: L,D-transpeptidase [Cellulomonas]MBO0901154.1 L,D-transpeptidase [Cellulomonas sp. zg-ZUI22]MBO0922534.1 L,D-transpeptidase [Cellulomonas wangleii]MBO0926761.1 L,D-transpeptidase [Cellulomonas wangleii]QVI63130.1 L,D-transpeptidase [Cellulomonas wangleii]
MRASGWARPVAVALLGAAVAAGCASEPPAPEPVVVRAPVDVVKAAVPPPPVVPAADLSTLPVAEPRNLVPGLPGTDGLEQRRNDDPALGAWQTATVVRDTAGYDAINGSPVATVPAVTLDVPTVLPVVEQRGGWLRVMLATRSALPSQDVAQVNGRTAWIRAQDTTPSGTDWRLHLDLAALTLTIDDGATTRTVPVTAVGAPATPTPAIPQFVVGSQWEQPGTSTPRVLLLSSQSETIDVYDTATGTSATAIHTTPFDRTGAISNGCVRVSEEVLDMLWDQVPAGTVLTVS